MKRQQAFVRLVMGCALLLAGSQARAVTPESPEVLAVIDRGVAFLEKAASDSRLGGHCLAGLCMLKNGKPANHPKVVEALKSCQERARAADSEDNYSTGLAIIFLCELDVGLHKATAEAYLRSLLKRQQAGGGWGYPMSQTGDTSQVQYATLGMWTADAAGLQVPQEAVERLCAYLMRTQDPSGGWGYQANDPGTYNRVAQSDVRPSLAAGGLGSLYICADLLDIHDRQKKNEESELPPALRPVQSKADAAKRKRRPGTRVIDETMVRRAMADGNTWFARNFKVKTDQYQHYYLYGFERYASYRELAEGRVEREPEWYNQVFDFLRRTQGANGSWDSGQGEAVDTSFAVLCLSRSSRKSIQKIKPLGEGTLLGGMGLPPTTADLQERDGKVVETPLAGSIDELLAIIEDPDNPQLSRLAAAGEVVELSGDVTKRSGQITRLRALVSAGSFESRLVAVKMLSKVRDLDNVPVLLYALTDPISPTNPDLRIVREADKGLRFISRKFAGVGLPEEPTPTDVKNAQKAWKEWFLSVRPDAELLD
jgi:hypothetical protein